MKNEVSEVWKEKGVLKEEEKRKEIKERKWAEREKEGKVKSLLFDSRLKDRKSVV